MSSQDTDPSDVTARQRGGTCRLRVKCRTRGRVRQSHDGFSSSICFGISLPVASDSGQPLAMHTGMLRITVSSPDSPKLVTLEGKLTGLWAQELLRVAQEASAGTVFDLQEVFYVDSAGEVVLRTLGRSGAKFITDSAYGKDLCKRLKLRRVSGPHRSTADAVSSEQIPEIRNAGTSSSGFPGPQRSRCRE